MDELNKLALRHEKWCALVLRMGCNKSDVEDIVQDSYIRIYEYLKNGVDIKYGDDDVNEFYFYLTLRSVYVNSVKKNKIKFIDAEMETLDHILSNIRDEFIDCEEEEAFASLEKKIYREINTWDNYYQRIFVGYYTTNMSLRKMSNETDIGFSSLYNSLIKHKQILIDAIGEDFEDYINGDYHKL